METLGHVGSMLGHVTKAHQPRQSGKVWHSQKRAGVVQKDALGAVWPEHWDHRDLLSEKNQYTVPPQEERQSANRDGVRMQGKPREMTGVAKKGAGGKR